MINNDFNYVLVSITVLFQLNPHAISNALIKAFSWLAILPGYCVFVCKVISPWMSASPPPPTPLAVTYRLSSCASGSNGAVIQHNRY
jgi:hypothetical protein